MLIKLSIVVLIVILWRIGGWIKGSIRDVPIPIILALYFAWVLKWWMFFPVGLLANVIRLGYGEPSPDDDKPSFLGCIFRVGWLIRLVYGLTISTSVALPIALHTQSWLGFYLYVGANTVVNGVLCYFKAKDCVIEPIVGATYASVVFLV